MRLASAKAKPNIRKIDYEYTYKSNGLLCAGAWRSFDSSRRGRCHDIICRSRGRPLSSVRCPVSRKDNRSEGQRHPTQTRARREQRKDALISRKRGQGGRRRPFWVAGVFFGLVLGANPAGELLGHPTARAARIGHEEWEFQSEVRDRLRLRERERPVPNR